jgi:hypothetical protein
LLYRLEMGKLEQTVFQQWRPGDRIPERIANAPELIFGLALYMNGFYTLTSMRGSAYGTEGPIPWLAMRDYCDEHQIIGWQRQDFYDLLSRMDQAYLDYKFKKQPKPNTP